MASTIHMHHLATVRGNSICTRTIERVASIPLEIPGRRVHVTLLDSIEEAAAIARREEVRLLVTATPGREFKRLETLEPGRAGVVSRVDSVLDARLAVSGAVDSNDEGGAVGAESGHDGKDEGDGELNLRR